MLYLIEYVDKILKYAGTLPCLRQHSGKIAAGAALSEGSPVRATKRVKSGICSRATAAPAQAFRRIVRPDMNGGFQQTAKPRSARSEEVHGSQDEFQGIVHRLGHALQKRLARRGRLPRAGELADRRGHPRPGAG